MLIVHFDKEEANQLSKRESSSAVAQQAPGSDSQRQALLLAAQRQR